MKGIQRAVKAIGNQSELARRLGIKPQAVQAWVQQGRVPARRVAQVAAISGVPPHELNPESHPRVVRAA